METIYDKCERADKAYKVRAQLEREYERAKAAQDWRACARAVEGMRRRGQ